MMLHMLKSDTWKRKFTWTWIHRRPTHIQVGASFILFFFFYYLFWCPSCLMSKINLFRWDDDVVFKNQARGESKTPKRFINDTIRNDFHRKFLHKYMKWYLTMLLVIGLWFDVQIADEPSLLVPVIDIWCISLQG